MNQIYNAFDTVFSGGATQLQGYALALFFTLATIDFTWSFIMWTLENASGGGNPPVALLVRKVMCYGAILWLINDYSKMITAVMEGFVQIGSVLGGGNSTTLEVNTEEIFRKGVLLVKEFLGNISGMIAEGAVDGAAAGIQSALATLPFAGGTGLGGVAIGAGGGALLTFIVTLLMAIGIFICFTVIALQVLLTLLEFKIIGSYIIILLPFLVFKPLSFLGEKGINILISFGVKLSVLTAIATGFSKILNLLDSIASSDQNFETMALYFGGVLLITWLSWQAPALAASLMSGGTSLTAGGIVRSGIATAGTAIAGGMMIASGGISKGSGALAAIKNKLGGGEKASKMEGGNSGGNGGISPNGAFNDSSGGNVLNSENAGGESRNNSSSGESNSSEQNSSSASFSSGAILNGESGGSSSNTSSLGNSGISSNPKMGYSNLSQEPKASTASGTNSNNGSANSGISSNPAMGSNSSQESKTSTVSDTNSNSGFIGSQNTNSSTNSGSSNGVLKSHSTINNSSASTEMTKTPMSEKIKDAGNKVQSVLNKTNAMIPEEEKPQ